MFSELPPFTLVHVIISLIAIASGFVVWIGLSKGKMLDSWTATFLATTVLTSVTGFFLPATHLMPSHIVGILSMIVLGGAIAARYLYHLRGTWRGTYVVTAMVAFYFNFFVLVAQLFAKVPALRALAPTQSEPPFVIAQGTVLALFVVLTVVASRGFRRLGPVLTAH
jgi:hypothetical protein